MRRSDGDKGATGQGAGGSGGLVRAAGALGGSLAVTEGDLQRSATEGASGSGRKSVCLHLLVSRPGHSGSREASSCVRETETEQCMPPCLITYT